MSASGRPFVGLITGPSRRFDPEHILDELAGLADAAGATVVLRAVQERPKPDPATLIGPGKVETLAAACDEAEADVVIFDNELSPAQLRNLEQRAESQGARPHAADPRHLRARARTREGKLQVELAQLQYLLPRLVGSSAALSRLGGGIGTRGPGETKLETDRRESATASACWKEIESVRSRRAAAAGTAAQGCGADGGARRLHQRRQDDALQRADRRRGGGVERALRDTRSSGPQGQAPGSPRAARLRHRRLHRSPAALAGRRIPRHARGGRRADLLSTSWTRRTPIASGRSPPSGAC